MSSKSGTNTRIVRMNQFDHGVLDYLFRKAGEQDPKPNADFFKDPKNILLVSYTNEQLSGFLWAYILDRPDSPYPKMLLYSIDVFYEFRRQGIASSLVEELKRIAGEHGCREMFVPTQKSNVAAVGLFNKTKGKVMNEDDVTFIYDRGGLT